MATSKITKKNSKVVPIVNTTSITNTTPSSKMSADKKRVIAIVSVTVILLLAISILLVSRQFVGKAIEFDTTAIGVNQIGVPVSGSAEKGDIVDLPVYVNLGGEKSYAFSVKVVYNPYDFVEFQYVTMPEGVVLLDKEVGLDYIKIVGVSLGDIGNAPPALTGNVKLFTLSFKVIEEGGISLTVPEAEMYNEQGDKISLTSVYKELMIEDKPVPVVPVACSTSSECAVGETCENSLCKVASAGLICGDGEMDTLITEDNGEETITSEGCDDHNAVSGDGCSADCAIQAKWQCSGVPSICQKICTDECSSIDKECDASGKYLSCEKVGVCWKKSYKTCQSGTSCSKGSCVVPVGVCGDGKIDTIITEDMGEETTTLEACDDGNTIDGDGCSSDCLIKNYEICTGGNDEDGDGAVDCADTDCAALAQCKDFDKDGVIDLVDNCPKISNSDQTMNKDNDDLGDVCDTTPCGSKATLLNGACQCQDNTVNLDSTWGNGCEACIVGYEDKGGVCVKSITAIFGDGDASGCLSTNEFLSLQYYYLNEDSPKTIACLSGANTDACLTTNEFLSLQYYYLNEDDIKTNACKQS